MTSDLVVCQFLKPSCETLVFDNLSLCFGSDSNIIDFQDEVSPCNYEIKNPLSASSAG